MGVKVGAMNRSVSVNIEDIIGGVEMFHVDSCGFVLICLIQMNFVIGTNPPAVARRFKAASCLQNANQTAEVEAVWRFQRQQKSGTAAVLFGVAIAIEK